MPNYMCVSRLQANSGVPADQVENTFYFATATTADDLDFSAVITNWSEFWNNLSTTGASPGNYIANSMSRTAGAHILDFYLMPGAPGPVGPPVSSKTFSLPATLSGGTPLPQELAVAVSYHSDYTGVLERGVGGTRPRARRRGRFFFGPTIATALVEAGSTPVGAQTVHSDLMTTLTDNASEFATNMAASDTPWQVFSRTDWTAHQTIAGFVDDAWDVQRRRGQPASSRISW